MFIWIYNKLINFYILFIKLQAKLVTLQNIAKFVPVHAQYDRLTPYNHIYNVCTWIKPTPTMGTLLTSHSHSIGPYIMGHVMLYCHMCHDPSKYISRNCHNLKSLHVIKESKLKKVWISNNYTEIYDDQYKHKLYIPELEETFHQSNLKPHHINIIVI